MQPDTDLLDALRTDLAELTALHAPSGAEQAVIARLRDLAAALALVEELVLHSPTREDLSFLKEVEPSQDETV